MTEQSILDRLWQHFVVERKPFGLSEDGVCQYRAESGACCAVGLFIPDDEYTPDMEHMGPADIGEELHWPAEVVPLLEQAQNVHDEAALLGQRRGPMDPYEEIQRRLEMMAEAYELVVPELP